MLDGGFSLPDRLLDATEVAALLGVPRSWVYQETRAGRMPHVTVGRYRRYRREALEAWIDAHEHGPVQRRRPRPNGAGSQPYGAHSS
jgi:excisionase family DNA binding protein